MHKHEFLAQLRKGLSGLPRDDVEERLSFYSEMIDDQMEEGLSEEEAVSAAGSVDEIVAQTIAERTHADVVQVIGNRFVLYKPAKKPVIELPKAAKK